MTLHLHVDPHVDSIVMPENLKVGMMVNQVRRECARKGISCKYTGFAFGQSPFHVPNPLEKALGLHADKGHYSEAEGIPELREAIAGFCKRYFGLAVDPARIVVGPGTKSLIFTVFTMISGHVIIPSPSWIGYFPQLKLLGKHYHILYTKSENDFKVRPSDLEDFLLRLSHEKQQHLLVINNPHNPTGSLYSKDELVELADICRRNDTFIMSDEIYALSTFKFDEFCSMGSVFPEGTFILNGLSKEKSAGGYRLGYCILPEQESKKITLDFMKIAATVYTNVATPMQYAAIAAYEPNEEIDEYITITREIHRIMGEFFSEQFNGIDGITATTPKGTFYFYADFNQLADVLKSKGVMNSNELAHSLMAHPHHVATITGDSLILRPNDYGARIAFVDYDGKAAFYRYKDKPPKTKEEEIDFVKENAPRMIRGIRSLDAYVEDLKN
jgi:aspartate aminotransferase